MGKPTLYIQAGPNGVGKSTTYDDYIPRDVEFVNTDEISKLIKEKHPTISNTSELANDEALKLINSFILDKSSYGIETNLHDTETWNFIKAHKDLGYEVKLNFLTIDSIETLNKRIQIRVANDGHFVRPDVVRQRYESGIELLKQNFSIPDKLHIIDCSKNEQQPVITLENGKVAAIHTEIPEFLTEIASAINKSPQSEEIPKSVEDIRAAYVANKTKGDTGMKM